LAHVRIVEPSRISCCEDSERFLDITAAVLNCRLFLKCCDLNAVSQTSPGKSCCASSLPACECFPKGCQNIEVAGLWGTGSTPKGIRRATILLALRILNPSCSSGTGSANCDDIDPSVVKSVEWPDFKITFRDDFGTTSVDTFGTGYSEVDRILKNYITMSDIFLC
jgi:hypothetical protein